MKAYSPLFFIVLFLLSNLQLSAKGAETTMLQGRSDSAYRSTATVGYVILNEKDSFAKQVTGHPNTVFEIRYNYDLYNAIVRIPKGCTLLFRGGTLSRGTLIGTNTIIDADECQIFGGDLKLDGSFGNSDYYADWFGSIQIAVDLAGNNGGIVRLSPKTYRLNEPLVLSRCVSLIGSGNEGAYLEGKGTIITYSGQDAVVKLSGVSDAPAKNIIIKNLKIRGNGLNNKAGSNIGLYIGQWAYYCKFENISLYGCSSGVAIEKAWNLIFEQVNPYYCFNGFNLLKNISPLTTSSFVSCVAYSCKVGFNLAHDMNGVTLMSCGTDGCDTSMKLSSCYGVSVLSYTFENHTYGVYIDSPDCYVTFVGLSPRAYKDDSATHIKIDRVGGVTFTDMYISNATVPKKGLVVDVARDSAAKVRFNNCVIKGKGRNLETCTFSGNAVFEK